MFVAKISAAMVGLAVLQAAIRIASRILIFNGGRRVEYELRGVLFEHLLALPQSFFRKNSTGEVMSRLTNDLSAVRLLFGPGVLNIINTGVVYATGLWLMVKLNPTLTLWAVAPMPLVVVLARLTSKMIYIRSRALQTHMGSLSSHLQEDLSGVAVMRGYGLTAQREARFEALNEGYLSRSLALARTRGALGPILALAGAVGTLIVLWAGGQKVIEGEMTVGDLVAFNAYLVYLTWPTLALGWVLSMWQRGLAGWDRVKDILDEPPLPAPAARSDGEQTPNLNKPVLEARRLSVRMGDRQILRDVSFSIQPGQKVALVGATGSGKTTVADAIMRLVDVAPGSIFLGGVDVTAMPLATLRRQMAYAPQDPFLFSASIAQNIDFGQPAANGSLTDSSIAGLTPRAGVPLEDVRSAAVAAGLSRELSHWEEGLATKVGERGITLSGGQRQRVALARALHAGGQFVILDDSLSSVDADTEHDILSRLLPSLANRSALIISHRVAAVREADVILVLDSGRIVERGTHHALSKSGGVYARLYREQIDAAEARYGR